MPGESNTIGEYTAAEIAAMDAATFQAAKESGFRKALVASPLAQAVAQAEAAGINLGSSVPARDAQPSGDENVWGRKRKGDRDFVCPSGQKCRLRRIEIDQLVMAGVLDQVSRLEGLAQNLIDKAEGQPPAKTAMPTKEDFQALLSLMNVVVPMAVAEPKLYADDDPDRPADGIRVSDVDLEDRIAILNEALAGVKLLDNFRPTR